MNPPDTLARYAIVASRIHGARTEPVLIEALDAALKELLAMLSFSAGIIRLHVVDDLIEVRGESIHGGAELCFLHLGAPDCLCGEALAGEGEAMVSSVLAEPGCGDAGFVTALACPIPLPKGPGGLFFAVCQEKTVPSAESILLVETICRHIGEAVERIVERRAERERTRDLEAVHHVARLITAKLTLKEMVAEIVECLGDVLETDQVNVTLYDEESQELSFLARHYEDGVNYDEPAVYPLSDGMNSWIVKNRKPLLMTYDTEEECRKLGIRHGGRPARSWLGAPMIYQEQVVGTLSVQSYLKAGLYDERSEELLAIVADQCAVAVQNARLYEEVVRREREREKLYFSLTHDLLSLLSPVSGFARLLKALPEQTDRAEYLSLADKIIGSSEKISQFIEDVLVWGQIQSGKLTLNIERNDVMAVARAAMNAHTPQFLMRRIQVTLNGRSWVDESEPVIADFDVAQMERVFLNLIGNGVKHARSVINVEVMADDDTVSCRVRDDGAGVAADQVSSLFEEYVQATGVTRRKGVGLGLPTVKKIVELHHGALLAESDRGQGFMLEFSWPRTLAHRI